MSTETPPKSSTIVQKGLNINLQNKQMRNYLKWASLNVLVLTILLMDLSNKCPYAFSHWYYVEYAAAALLMLSIFCYTLKYVYYLLTFDPIKGTSDQKRLLHFDEAGNSMCNCTQILQCEIEVADLNLNTINSFSFQIHHLL